MAPMLTITQDEIEKKKKIGGNIYKHEPRLLQRLCLPELTSWQWPMFEFTGISEHGGTPAYDVIRSNSDVRYSLVLLQGESCPLAKDSKVSYETTMK